MRTKILRKPYRKILTWLTKKTLQKHNPTVIVVMGDGQTSIGREMVYHLIKSKYPARRNLESPEAEFSVPLTVLGYTTYPQNALAWLWLLIKSYFLIIKNPSYHHFLVLELNFVLPDLLSYWLDVLKPDSVLIVGRVPLDYSEFGIKKVVKISQTHTEETLKPFKLAASQLGRYYKLSQEDIDKALKAFSFPSSKIRYFPGTNGSILIDATHYYFPVKLGAVLELVHDGSNVGRKIIFSHNDQDKALLRKNKVWEKNPNDYEPQPNDVIILRGPRPDMIRKFGHLFASDTPLI